MPRKPRIEFPDAWYHVMNRGARKQAIFLNNNHHNQFLDVLADTCITYKLEVHAYCLMGNHYHLLVKTPLGNLGKCMKHLNGTYTQRFNLIQKIDGPVFRGRYQSIIVDSNEYLLQVSRYIHLNPVTASITEKPEQYNWSSYRDYLSTSPRRHWLHTKELLSQFNYNHQAYRRFTEEGVDVETDSFYRQKTIPAILGENEFRERLLASVRGQTPKERGLTPAAPL